MTPGTSSDDTSKQLRYLAAALKAPRITVAAQRLAEQARDAGWTHEDYLAAGGIVTASNYRESADLWGVVHQARPIRRHQVSPGTCRHKELGMGLAERHWPRPVTQAI